MSNEITVRLKCSIEEICKILKEKKFNLVEKYLLDDTYFIPKTTDVGILSVREILSKAILLRNIEEIYENNIINKNTKITFKKKNYAKNGDILNQEKVDCEIKSTEDGKKFIESIGYKNLMKIKERGLIFKNGEFEIQVKDIINGDKLIEVEIIENNEKFNTIEKLKNEINKLNIPFYKDNYFVKKAEIELKKIL